MRRLLFLLPILLIAGLLAMFWLALDPKRDPTALPSVLIGQQAPAAKLPGLGPAASEFDLRQFAGQPVLVNFFASWCLPCRAEHAALRQLGETYHIAVLGIAWKDKPADTQAFLSELGNPYRAIGVDESGRTGLDFGITGVPETFIIDKDGIVRYRLGGPITPDNLKDDLAPVLARVTS